MTTNNYHGFHTKEELTSHAESVISCLGEYEGTKAFINQLYTHRGETTYSVKKKSTHFSTICRTIEQAVDKFLEYENKGEQK